MSSNRQSFGKLRTGSSIVNRQSSIVIGVFISLFLLAACQPQVLLVDVTRLVEMTPAGGDAEMNGAETAEIVEVVAEPVEVTRVVTTEVVEEVIVEVTQSPLGTAERPVQILFAPTVKTAVITTRGQQLVQTLTDATGMNYEIGVLDDEKTVIDLMCAAPVDTISFLSAVGYVIAHEQCGVQPGMVAIQPDGLIWQAGMIVTRRDSGLNTIEDLAGTRWAVPDNMNIPAYFYIQAMLADAGVEVGQIVAVPGDSDAMLAVYNGEVDFATAAYIPPILPYEERLWEYGEDSPEIWRRLGISPNRSPIGYVLAAGEPQYGGYRLRDARSRIFDIVPGIYDETRIVSLSAPIPNDSIAFGADFPLGLAREVMVVLTQFAASEACISSVCSTDFYGWAGLELADDDAYEPLRFMVETLGWSGDEIVGP